MAILEKRGRVKEQFRHAPIYREYCLCDRTVIIYGQGNLSRAAYPLTFSEGQTLQTKERRAMPMYVTYQDLVQIGIFIVALVGLLYQIFRGKK